MSVPNPSREARRAYKVMRRSTLMGRALTMYDNAKRRARVFDVDFDLTREWIADRLLGRCPLTGRSFELKVGGNGVRNNPYAPSLDRIDPKKGYTMDNVRVITTQANVARNQWGDDLLVQFAKDVLQTISSQAPSGEGSTTRAKARRVKRPEARGTPTKGEDIVSPTQRWVAAQLSETRVANASEDCVLE